MACNCHKTYVGTKSVNVRCTPKGVYTGKDTSLHIPSEVSCNCEDANDRIYIKPNLLDNCCVSNVIQVGKTSDWDAIATDVVPLEGQIIVYTDDETGEFYGFKIGNGCADLANLNFASLGDANNCDCSQMKKDIAEALKLAETNSMTIADLVTKVEQSMTVDQTFDETSKNAQSGVAIYNYIKDKGLTADQTYDATSENAQSGKAVAEAITQYNDKLKEDLKENTDQYITIDQTYDATSKNAQSGTAVAEAIKAQVDQTYDKASEKAQSGKAVAEAIEASVSQAYSETNKKAMSGVAVAQAITNNISQTYDETSDKAMSGVAVAEALKNYKVDVDKTYDATSENAQSGVAVAEAIKDYDTKLKADMKANVDDYITVDQTYDKTSKNAQSGTAVAEAIETAKTEIKEDINNNISEYITIDQTVTADSENAVSSKAVYEAIDASKITVDDALDADSENPVQNKVVKAEFDKLKACLHTTLTAAGWSTSTTTVSGVAYYTQDVTATEVYEEHPAVALNGASDTDFLPTEDAESEWTNVKYAYANGNTITFYATAVPSVDLNVIIRGAK